MNEAAFFPEDRIDRVLSWVRELDTDARLMILVGAAYLDDLLTRMLQAAMAHQPGGSDPLFDADRPLGTFSARIQLAYRLGLLSREFESFLQTLRKLRNDAAHAVHEIDLFSSPHIDRVIHLQLLASKCPMWPFIEPNPIDPKTDPRGALVAPLTVAVFSGECALLGTNPMKVETVCGFELVRIAEKTSNAAAGQGADVTTPE